MMVIVVVMMMVIVVVVMMMVIVVVVMVVGDDGHSGGGEDGLPAKNTGYLISLQFTSIYRYLLTLCCSPSVKVSTGIGRNFFRPICIP